MHKKLVFLTKIKSEWVILAWVYRVLKVVNYIILKTNKYKIIYANKIMMIKKKQTEVKNQNNNKIKINVK